MKKFVCVLLIGILAFAFVGCTNKKDKETEGKVKEIQEKMEKEIEAMKTFPVFESKDINGKDVSSDLFKENKLTMVNVWGTFCGPCVEEMPDLQKLYEEVKDQNINIIGLIADAKGNEEAAKEIISKTKVEYMNIVPDKNIDNGLLKNISAVPTSIFVNEKGEIVGELIIGTRSKEEYKKLIEETLKTIQ